MNDIDPQFESELRAGLQRRAAQVDATEVAVGARAIGVAAEQHTARRRSRRLATASIATVAAVAVGLVVIARDPGTQAVRTEQPASGELPGLAAGAATGSTTGAATGSPTGWTHVGSEAPADTSALPHLTLDYSPTTGLGTAQQATGIPGGTSWTTDYSVSSYGARRDGGEAAADLAVAADVAPGSPLRFVVASVQDAKRLSPGKGGTETTIAGRHARVISRRGATTLLWDLSDQQRVLVVTGGINNDDLEAWLGALRQDANGTWAFDPATTAGGLKSVATTTPTDQVTRSQNWSLTFTGTDGTCEHTGASLGVANGGTYEFWARMADTARWNPALPEVVKVMLPGATQPTWAFWTAEYRQLTALDGDVVVDLSTWSDTRWDTGPQSVVTAESTLAMLRAATDPEWPTLAVSTPALPSACDERKGKPVPATAPPTTIPATTAP